MSTEPFKIKDILYGLVVPILVAILILLFPTVIRSALDGFFPPPDMMTGDPGSPYAFITVIFTHGFALMVMFGVPLILGLIWNKWAGGAAGFIMGTLLYLANAGYNIFRCRRHDESVPRPEFYWKLHHRRNSNRLHCRRFKQ